jgi:hypothetical protein
MRFINLKTRVEESSIPFPTVLCIGNFDGVHLGHRQLVNAVLEKYGLLKKVYPNLTCGAWFFDSNFYKNTAEIYTLDEKLDVFASLGLEYAKKREYNSATNTYVEYYVVVGIGTCTDKEIAIPAEYNGLPVLRIGDSAFQNCKQITKVYLPTSVKSFALAAFWGCSNIERFEYEGTIDQWLAINKNGDSWNTGLDKDCTVRCEDGVIAGDGTIFRD